VLHIGIDSDQRRFVCFTELRDSRATVGGNCGSWFRVDLRVATVVDLLFLFLPCEGASVADLFLFLPRQEHRMLFSPIPFLVHL
jgi:hypothetical protein